MNEEARTLIREKAGAAAAAWAPALAELGNHWRDRVPDWERVFPGLVALIGLQTLVWPHWMLVTRRSQPSPEGAAADAQPPIYEAPSLAGQTWRFAYSPAGPQSAWAFACGPGAAPWDATLAVLNRDDVRLTLSTLDSSGRVVTHGQASSRLRPLQGDMGEGDRPVRLPLCECRVIAEMLPDWRASADLVLPLLAESAQRLLALDPEADPALAYADLAWAIWGELLDRGCIAVGMKEEKRTLKRVFAKPAQHPFVGVLVLRGDHYALWDRVNQSSEAAGPACP